MDNETKTDLALYLGHRIVADADKLRLFAPDCFARFPVEWDGHQYEVRVIYRGEADDGASSDIS